MRDYFYRAWKAILSYGSFGRSCSAVSHTFTSRLLDILLYSNNPSSLKENYAGHAGTVQCAQLLLEGTPVYCAGRTTSSTAQSIKLSD
jgi:hypothetical protein